jgi:hypothetical protein
MNATFTTYGGHSCRASAMDVPMDTRAERVQSLMVDAQRLR